MPRNNKWTFGLNELVIPPLPPTMRGVSGCLLTDAIFDLRVGNETYLAIFEDAEYAEILGTTLPFQLFCKPGLMQTSHGTVAFMVFTVSNGESEVALYDKVLDPHEPRILALLSQWAQQTHFKALIINSDDGNVYDWFEFRNQFEIEQLVHAIPKLIANETRRNFALAEREFMAEYSLDDLKSM